MTLGIVRARTLALVLGHLRERFAELVCEPIPRQALVADAFKTTTDPQLREFSIWEVKLE